MKIKKLLLSIALSGLLALCALTAVLFHPLTVRAEEQLWKEDYYRVSAPDGGLSDMEIRSLDENCLEFLKTWHTDLAMLALDAAEKYEGVSLPDIASSYYQDSGFGYGPGGDGFMMIWDTSSDTVLIEAYGAAGELIPRNYLDHVAGSVLDYEKDYGTYGPMYATFRYLSNYLEGDKKKTAEINPTPAADPADTDGQEDDWEKPAGEEQTDPAAGSTAAAEGTPMTLTSGEDSSSSGSGERPVLPEGQVPDPSLRYGEDGEAAGRPAWYPKDTETFPFYHDPGAPRVVDQADLFTDDEEMQMETRLAELRGQLQRDIVVFTDRSAYGFSHTQYADDFFDYNGYGIGDEFEGICLMVCMDPDDRGWWTSCFGPDTMGLYTETVANQIDDLLYEYMVDADYGAGVQDWIENVRRMYVTGSPYSDEWALIRAEGFQRFHDADAPRVVDDAGILTPEEIDSLTAQARKVSDQYGVDVVVHTALNEGILERDTYGDQFFLTHGYGLGDSYDGIQLTIFKRPNYSGGVRVNASGSGLEKLTEVNQKRLESRCEDQVLGRDYYEAASQWLDQTEHMLRTGRAPRSSASWGFFTALELIAGLIFGGVSLGRAKARMVTPAVRENADSYVVDGSLQVRKVEDTLVDTTVSRTYSPPPKKTSSGGSSGGGGRSSYSHSHTSSSGRTHSGSGRRF